jgi:hypothetical protein
MDFNPIAMPLCLAVRETHVHACIHYRFQSFVVHA